MSLNQTAMSLNPLDWLLGIILIYSIVRAAIRGFFRESFALGGLILGFLLACWFYQSLAPRLHGLIASDSICRFVAFVLILLATMIVATIIAKLLKRTASAIGLGIVDRLFGALFGLVRGCLLCLALLMACTAFLPSAPWVENSSLAPYFLRASHAVSFVMPFDLKQRLIEGAQHIKHTTPDWIKSGIPSHTE
jgi:membrane protein required for colicin V production